MYSDWHLLRKIYSTGLGRALEVIFMTEQRISVHAERVIENFYTPSTRSRCFESCGMRKR